MATERQTLVVTVSSADDDPALFDCITVYTNHPKLTIKLIDTMINDVCWTDEKQFDAIPSHHPAD